MLLDALRVTALHLAWLIGPTLFAAVVLHQLNVLTTRVLGGTFGASSVVWFTGWLGTPVHELSHAAAAVLFWHRIHEIVLFRPDPAAGTVGYVRYTWSPRNPWSLLGHGFVGIAPLFGGAAVLAALFALLAPGEVVRPLVPNWVAEPAVWTAQLSDWAAALLQPAVWKRPSSWLLAYLVLCVGTHLAPSGADLKGAGPSLALLFVLVGLVDLGLVLSLGQDGTAWIFAASSVMAPVVAMLAIAAMLVGMALAGVLLTATLWSAFTGRGLFAPLRMLFAEPWRLGTLAVAGILASSLL